MIKVSIGGTEFPAEVNGIISDLNWDGRSSKAITFTGTYETASTLFVNDASWAIVIEETRTLENGEEEIDRTVFDNSEYSIAGDITDHRDGTMTVKMGMATDLEDALELLLG